MRGVKPALRRMADRATEPGIVITENYKGYTAGLQIKIKPPAQPQTHKNSQRIARQHVMIGTGAPYSRQTNVPHSPVTGRTFL